MRSVIKNMIQYFGLAEELPDLNGVHGFKRLNLEDNFKLSLTSVPLKQIIKVMVQIETMGICVQKTQPESSTGGQILTGKKLLVEGKVEIGMQYVSNLPSNSVHIEHFRRPFCSFLILNKDFEIESPVITKGFAQDICVKCVNEREVYFNINMLITAR